MVEDITIKILFLGESSVGKSSILSRFANNSFDSNALSTIGIDYIVKVITYNNKTVKLNIVDSSGQERFRTIGTNYYRGADAILFVYDITQKDTLQKSGFWMKEIKEKSNSDITLMFFGNKTDLENQRQISVEDGNRAAEKLGVQCFEGSALTGQGISEVINNIVDMVIKKKGFIDESKSESTIHLGDSVLEKNGNSGSMKRKKEKMGCC